MVKNVVSVPKIDSDGLPSGTKKLQKAISMNWPDAAMILGCEPEDTGDDEVLFSKRCHLACVRDSQWRKTAEGFGELFKNRCDAT